MPGDCRLGLRLKRSGTGSAKNEGLAGRPGSARTCPVLETALTVRAGSETRSCALTWLNKTARATPSIRLLATVEDFNGRHAGRQPDAAQISSFRIV